MEVSEELMLTWGSHQLTLVNEVAQLRHQGCFADVTLACEGRLYLAHKFILAMCSDYFRNIFGPSGVGGSNSSLVVVLKDVACQDVEHLLDYMYTGVVAVEKSGLQSLIRTAENLQIKGLAFADSPDVSLPSPERHDPSAFVGGASRQEEVITEDHSPANSRRINSIAPDVRLNRVGSNASRVPVNSREGISPPSKRKRLQDSGGQAVSNSSNTSTTFTSNIRTSSSVSLPQMFSSKRRVSPPGGQPFFSTSSPTDVPAMPIFTEPQSPIMPPCSPLQFRQAVCSVAVPVSLASKSFRDSPERPPGSSEHHSLVSCSLPMVVSSASQPVSVMVRHSPTGCTGEGEAQRPENLEIKKEEPDGDATTGASTEILLSVDGGGPSNEASELKEEPPPEEGESGPSGLHAGLECWGAAEGGLLADAADEDEISDTDGTGDEDNSERLPPKEGASGARSPPSAVRTDLKTEPEEDSPGLFSMPATTVTELVTSAALKKDMDCVSAKTDVVSGTPKVETEDNVQDIFAVCPSVPESDVVSAFETNPPGSGILFKLKTVAGDCDPLVPHSGALRAAKTEMCTRIASLPVVHAQISAADTTHSTTKSESTGNSFGNIERVEEWLNSDDPASLGVRQSIGKSIFEVASPVAITEESERNVTLSACLHPVKNDATSEDCLAVPRSATSLIGMATSGFGYPSVLSKISDAAAIASETLSQKTSDLGLTSSSTKSILVSALGAKSTTSTVYSSSTISSLLENFDEPKAHNKSQEEDKEQNIERQVAKNLILTSKDTEFPVSSISESTRYKMRSVDNSLDVRSCEVNDRSEKKLCTGTSVNDRSFVEFVNPPSDAPTVIFELKSVPMSIDSDSSPENPDSEDTVEPVSLSNPSGTSHYDNRLIPDNSQQRDNADAQPPLQTGGRTHNVVSSNATQPNSGPRSGTPTVRCTQCPYTTASVAQLESHVRELHPDYFSQTMRSFRDSARTDHRDPVDFRFQDFDGRDANVSNYLPHGVKPKHGSDAQQKTDAVMEVRNNPSAPSVPSEPCVNQTRSASQNAASDFQSGQEERHCTQEYTGRHRFSAPLTVNVSPKGGAGVSQTRPTIPHTLLMRVPQLPPSQRMESHSPSSIRGQHNARGDSSSLSWHLASRNPLQPPQFVQRFPAPAVHPQIFPHSSNRSQFPHQLSQPRCDPTQSGLNRNIAYSNTSYSASVASTLQSELERSSQLPQNNYIRMMNHRTISTAPTTSASVTSQPLGSLHTMEVISSRPPSSLHPMAGVSSQSLAGTMSNPYTGITVNAGVRMSLPSPVHSNHTVTNNLRVQPVRVGIFPRCNERDLETVRQMAYPSVSGTQNLACFPSPLDFSAPPDFSQPPQPQPFMSRSPASARMTIQPESEKKFTCPYCYMTLFGRQTLFDHVAVHANNDRSTYRKSWCPYCTLKCGSQPQLVNHFKSHTAEEIG